MKKYFKVTEITECNYKMLAKQNFIYASLTNIIDDNTMLLAVDTNKNEYIDIDVIDLLEICKE